MIPVVFINIDLYTSYPKMSYLTTVCGWFMVIMYHLEGV